MRRDVRGLVVFVATFEVITHSGFVTVWWNTLYVPIALLPGVDGFVTYLYRETRAMTPA